MTDRARAAIVALHRGELRVPRTVLITEGCRTYAATEEEWEEIRRRREDRR